MLATSILTLLKMRAFLLLSFCLLCSVSLVGTCAAAGQDYILIGATLFGSQYKEAAVNLDISSDRKVAGTLQLHDSTKQILISGTNPTDGVLKLNFSDDPSHSFVLHKQSLPEKISWMGIEDRISLYRYKQGKLSAASLSVNAEGCGPSYGQINVRKSPKYSDQDFLSELSTHPELKNVTASLTTYELSETQAPKTNNISGILPEILGTILRSGGLNGKLDENPEMEPISIEVGSESYVIQTLRSMNSIDYANLAQAGCDGADRVFFVTDKLNLFDEDKFSEDRYLNYLHTGINSLYSNSDKGMQYNVSISQPRLRKLKVPPYSVSATFQIVAASEVTRGTPGEWDMFNLVFEPFDTDTSRAGQYSIAVYAERLESSKRSLGNETPPGPEQFSASSPRDDEEDLIGQVVQRYFASNTGGVRCEHVTMGGVPDDQPVRGLAPCGFPQ